MVGGMLMKKRELKITTGRLDKNGSHKVTNIFVLAHDMNYYVFRLI